MKKILSFCLALAAAALALPSCVQNPSENLAGAPVTVRFTAGAPDTRTAFTTPEENSYPVRWTANDSKVKLALKMLAIEDASVTPAPDGKTATFTATFVQEYQAPYTFHLLSPASVYDESYRGEWWMVIPAEQTPTEQSVDEKAQILLGTSEQFSEIPQSVSIQMRHFTAYGLLNFENLSLGSARITGVEITAEKPLAGYWTYDVNSQEAAPMKDAVNTVKIQTTSATGIWFACGPVDLSGTKLSFRVKTDAGDFVKEVTLPGDRNLTSGKVARITVDMAGITPHIPGLLVQRIWGKYSTEAASWNEYYGGTPGTDRNLAMDDEYIYLPETTKAAKLWRISLDGQTVTEANVEGVTGGTFALSCVRMIPNASSKVNGGKDFLMGVSLTEGDREVPVYIYSYADGTDKAPKRTSASTGWGRRLGDKFTVYGSLQNGGLFFKDYNNIESQGAYMVLKMAWSDAPVDGYFNPRRTNMVPDGGIGAFYPYPDDPLHGVETSVNGGRTISMTESPLVANPNLSATWDNAGGYYKDAHGINYFTFHGKKYIAYGKNAGSNDGRIYVLEGESSDSWESMLNAKRKVIYQAAIQHDTAFTDGEYHAELEVPSPRSSMNFGLDVAVREIEGAVYIAVVKQNVGLSVFKMSYE